MKTFYRTKCFWVSFCLFSHIIVFISFSQLYAEHRSKTYIDSLLRELPKITNDSGKAKVLSLLSFGYQTIDPNLGIKYGKDALAIATKLRWKIMMATAYNYIGDNELNLSNYSDALDNGVKALSIDEDIDYKEGMANTLGNIGLIYSSQSRYSEALGYALQSLKINEEQKIDVGIAIDLTNIGNIYEHLGNYQKALDYYFESKNKYQILRDTLGFANVLGNIGNLYNDLDNYPKALEFFKGALEINEKLGDKSGMLLNLGNMGNTYTALKMYSLAFEHFFKALDLSQQLSDRGSIAIWTGDIGEGYLHIIQDTVTHIKPDKFIFSTKIDNVKKAIYYLKIGADSSFALGDLYASGEFYDALSMAYLALRDYEHALASYKASVASKDSFASVNSQLKIKSVESQYANELKDKEIKIDKLRKLSGFLILGGIIIVLLVIFIFVISGRKKSERERKRSDDLLLNILPKKIADRLKNGETHIADYFNSVSVIFIDLVGFTSFSSDRPPSEVVAMLDNVFSLFDNLTEKYGLEKIKTIGDCYMAVAGVPEQKPDHADAVAKMALEVKELMNDYKTKDGTTLQVRIGINCGNVVSGIIGKKKFSYDLWGDTVNIASRMESKAEYGTILCTEQFKCMVQGNYHFESGGMVLVKGKANEIQTWYLSSSV